MSRHEKLLTQWRNDPPTEEELSAVEAVLKRYGIRYSQPDHIVIHDDRLGDFEEIRGGDFTIPITRGHKVKRVYIKRLVRILEFLGVYEEIER